MGADILFATLLAILAVCGAFALALAIYAFTQWVRHF